MDIDSLALPDDIAALKEIVRRAMSRADAAEADSAAARAAQSDTAAYIEHLKLQIEKLKRALYGPRAELYNLRLHLTDGVGGLLRWRCLF